MRQPLRASVPSPRTGALPGRSVRARLGRLDRRALGWAAAHRSPRTDRVLTTLSGVANNGVLWVATAGVLAATGRRRPRTAAAAGLLGQGIASGLVNGPLKFVWRRDRPTTDVLGHHGTLLPLPRTYSFPSGHSASALAFATGVSTVLPQAAPVVLPLAGGVAYSRVHTGVHYPSDVLVGAGIGAVAGIAGARIASAVRASSVHRPDTVPIDVAVPSRAVVLGSSDSGSADGLETALAALREGGVEIVERFEVEDADRLAALLRDSGDEPPLVIAAGGDGTVGCAAGLVVGTTALLGVIPLGTSNDVARSLGVPPDPREAAAAIVDGVVCAIDTGRLEVDDQRPRVFVNAATAGLNVAFASLATEHSMRDRFGGLTYPVAAALALRRYQPFECSVVTDDGRRLDLDVVHLSVSNATVFGGVLGMRVPRADIADGMLDLIVIERLSVARLALAVADTVIGRHAPVHRVHAMQVRSVQVRAAAGQQVAADGEVVGELPARFAVVPGSLRVVIPRAD